MPTPTRSSLKNTSRVHGTIERTAGMLGVRSAGGLPGFRIDRSPASLFSGTPGQNNKRFLDVANPAGAGDSERPFARP
jgi:hypothetical protein